MKTSPDQKTALPTAPILYYFNHVPVMVQPDFWPAPVMLTGLLAYVAGLRHPEFSRLQRLGLGLLAMLVAIPADIGHAMAHTISARLAGAPMDEIFLSSGMPRTLYENNQVLPQTHIRRSLGGPIFSLTGFTLSLLWRQFTRPGSIGRDLAEASLAGHSFILLGSIAPLPMVDGGIILKWKLVEAGQSPEQADQTVQKTSTALGAAFLASGALLALSRKQKLVGGLLAAAGVAGIAAGLKLLK